MIHASKHVAVDALIDELWGPDPPASATNTIQTYISQLRRLLEPDRTGRAPATVLRTVTGGYQLDIDARTIDSVQFEQQIHDAQSVLDAGDGEQAATLLRAALALWRGTALTDVRGCAGADQEAARLEQLRLFALELRLTADLAMGRHAQVVADARQLTAPHPLQEKFTEYLMLALYRCGRQAEALGVYRSARAQLVDELGVEPGPDLRNLEQAILRQDPNLAAPRAVTIPSGTPEPDAAAAPAPASPSHRAPQARRRLIVLVTVMGMALVTAGAVWTTGFHRDRSPPHPWESPGTVFNQFDLATNPGIGYDLDIPPGRPSDWHATYNPRSPDYNYLDFYRTSEPTLEREQIGGVDVNGTNDFNAIHLVDPSDTVQVCRQMPRTCGGNVKHGTSPSLTARSSGRSRCVTGS